MNRTLFATYVPSMYIPVAHEVLPADPPVRFLSTADVRSEVLRAYDAPNYATGLAGAFLSQVSVPPILFLAAFHGRPAFPGNELLSLFA